MPIEIRRAAREEVDTLTHIAIAAKGYWGYPQAWIQEWMPLLTFSAEHLAGAEVFLALSDGQAAGFYRLFLTRPRARLEDLWIKPPFIGKGIGRALFQHLLLRCREAEAHVLEVEADPHAEGFYQKMGMTKVTERPSTVAGQANLPILEMKL